MDGHLIRYYEGAKDRMQILQAIYKGRVYGMAKCYPSFTQNPNNMAIVNRVTLKVKRICCIFIGTPITRGVMDETIPKFLRCLTILFRLSKMVEKSAVVTAKDKLQNVGP